MGSKTYEGDHYQHEPITSGAKPKSAGGKPRGAHLAEDGDGDYGNGDDDDDNLWEGTTRNLIEATDENVSKKKKRKRSKKKSKKPEATAAGELPLKQSSPPRVLLSNLFPSGVYPEGEVTEYHGKDENNSRTTNEEIRYLSRLHIQDDEFLNNYRQAAEVHRQVRQWVQHTAKPGKSLNEIAEGIEDGVRALLGHQGLEPGDNLKAGMGFPTGLPLNNCAAHYTPNPGQKEIVLQADDVMKVDFGVHINGWIVDSAFTVAFDPVYDNLLAAVKDATNTGIKNAGIDARMSDIGSAIQEAMESYEVEMNGKTLPVKAVRNITGHDIKQYRIHGGKQIPFIKNDDHTKMEEGEVFAIETFGSTGKGYLRDDTGVYGYGKDPSAPRVPLNLASARSVLKTINEHFGTLVFCRRYLERLGLNKYLVGLNSLVSNGILDSYAPLSDVKGSYTAQFEHTILLRPNAKEVVSRGDDY
ncbi:methionine aminopeptidase, type II [Rhinocladiella mackenziei CBS 650.93]|uniref:Methionine aminopeptidase 2 n=1 Tax=Rhinocladiella mackenziei CBS 650.93 TaxID=1442369 RepID=A0A0D2ISE6_9EURO|nr:methionine aminopeptidase, type II [Rhinocladiella mackenziei CBS 650.93]KIX08914.1 methionine aminopeptidase, type II [Rhinocladiella mackenziei CBS 650.93]